MWHGYLQLGSSGAVVKRADSNHSGCEFDSSTCHNENANGKEGNGKPPHKIHFPGIIQRPISGLCNAGNRGCSADFGLSYTVPDSFCFG